MVNQYYNGFDIDISNFTDVNNDIQYFISMLNVHRTNNHIIKNYFFEFLDKLEVISSDSFLTSYKDIGYLIKDNTIDIYTKNNDCISNESFETVYNKLYTENDICTNCIGLLFCTKIKELPHCLNNNFVYKTFYELLSNAIVSESIIL